MTLSVTALSVVEKEFNKEVTGVSAASDAGLIPILRKTVNILREMAQAYRDSAKEMRGVDEEYARNLSRNI